MGLDITYVSKIKECLDDNDISFLSFYIDNDHFEYHLGSLKKIKIYSTTSESDIQGFCAGSYGGYNDWRDRLAAMAGYGSSVNVWNDFKSSIRYLKLKKIEGIDVHIKPFYELINFSDCEGIIGPEICEKLYQDFVNFEDKAKEQEEYFYDRYLKWKEAFRVASDNGLVKFH